ncbi:putative glutamine/gamma-aminobutyrate antiporter GadC [Mycoplasmopsis ciconiae]|uniref:Glutamine/gamma-aminobutyrate antiporter GadC n=1 Tax=Mycoplasmopsis ciconiae TaxID=561067 RepID=A0ABU7MMV1_9BACT|nr:putative glutamine/gamma-aminobutyrate antiporter GadC [Mycoplasmopsis ciconiae]
MFKKSDNTTVSTQTNSTKSTGAIPVKAKKALSLSSLILMNIVAVVSLRGLPAESGYGLTSIFYYVFAAVSFLIPVALVAAELASTYTEKGGVFRWVGEAFGPKLAFVSMFLLWAEVTIWFPTALTFGAVSLAYISPDQATADQLSNNKYFVLFIVLAIYWIATGLSSLGTGVFSKVAKWGGIIGTIIPVIVLIGFGVAYYAKEGAPENFNTDIFPQFKNFDNLVLAASIFLFYAGMEMNAIHVTELNKPKRNYPLAIMISSIVTVLIFIFGTLSISLILPAKEFSLTNGLLITFLNAFKWAGVAWLGPIIAIMLAVGVLAGIVTWVSGPSNGMLAIAKAGYLPRWFQHTNKKGVPTHLLLVQGLIVTALSIFFVVLPSVEAAYQILSQLTVILYLIMYLLMFAAAIYLRYSQPNRPRPYHIPGKYNIGMLVVGGIGFMGSLLAFLLSFVPPSQINVGSPLIYVLMLIIAAIIFTLIPFIIIKFKKDHWKDPQSDFAPFTWEVENANPGLVNHSSEKTEDLTHKHFLQKAKNELKHIESEIVDKVKEEAQKLTHKNDQTPQQQS